MLDEPYNHIIVWSLNKISGRSILCGLYPLCVNVILDKTIFSPKTSPEVILVTIPLLNIYVFLYHLLYKPE